MGTHRLVTLTAAALVASASGLASATSLWHVANGEAGVTIQPDHIKSTRTRADVVQELDTARKDGSLWYFQRGLPAPEKLTDPGKTRAEMQRELLDMPAKERAQGPMIGAQ